MSYGDGISSLLMAGVICVFTLIGAAIGFSLSLILYFFIGAGGWIFLCIGITTAIGAIIGTIIVAIDHL